jgi:FkbM family methyltransferase
MSLELLREVKHRLADIGDACRRALAGTAMIASGPAAGLRFDAGADTVRFEKGDYEQPVQQALASLARPGDVCYDIGANLGFFSILLGHLVGPKGVVYAFEPVPANAAAIERNARLNDLGNVRVMRVALARSDGAAELLLAQHVGGAVLADAGAPPDPAGRLTVATAAVDSLLARGELAPPRLVKIDVEGAEMDVLAGMERTLREYAPTLVLELDDATLTECERKVNTCRDFLESLGYRTEPLPNSYRDGKWYVRHFLATRESDDA